VGDATCGSNFREFAMEFRHHGSPNDVGVFRFIVAIILE